MNLVQEVALNASSADIRDYAKTYLLSHYANVISGIWLKAHTHNARENMKDVLEYRANFIFPEALIC